MSTPSSRRANLTKKGISCEYTHDRATRRRDNPKHRPHTKWEKTMVMNIIILYMTAKQPEGTHELDTISKEPTRSELELYTMEHN